jgi:hypothetical protein
MSGSFTAEIVHGLLKAALKGSQRVPGVASLEVRGLAQLLTKVQRTVVYRRDHLPEDLKKANAIRVLTEGGVDMVADYAAACIMRPAYMGDELDFPSEDEFVRARSDLKAINALVAAAEVARKHGFPSLPVGVLDAPVEHWPGYALILMEAFKAATGGSKEAAYRFVAAVTPRLTGEEPTVGAIKVEVIRRVKEQKPAA